MQARPNLVSDPNFRVWETELSEADQASLGFGGSKRENSSGAGGEPREHVRQSWEGEGDSSTCLVAVSMHLSQWPCSTYRSKAATTSTPTSYGSSAKTVT